MHVSAALRSVLVTNSLLHWTQLLYMVRSCSSARVLLYVVSLRPAPFYIGHNLLSRWYVVVVLHVSAALRNVLATNSLLPLQSFIGHNCCIWYVGVVLHVCVCSALRSVVAIFLEVHVTHVYND